MIFDIDSGMVADSVSQALEEAGSQVSQEQFEKIADAINEGMPGVVSVITSGIAEHWKAEARNSGGWGNKYASAITYKVDGNEGEIYLDDELIDKGSNKPSIMFAKMTEQGMKSWSIKDAVLASEKAKTSKDGVKYIVIPFPVATPRKPSQGKMSPQFGGREMTQAMHKIVKSGGRLPAGSLLPSGQDVSGLTKYTTRQRHEGYGIFRCVSERSKGWVHSGVAPNPVYPKVIDEVERKVYEVIMEFCREIVKEYSKS